MSSYVANCKYKSTKIGLISNKWITLLIACVEITTRLKWDQRVGVQLSLPWAGSVLFGCILAGMLISNIIIIIIT